MGNLSCRGYKQAKLQENLDAEIMQVLLDEARESFDERLVIELRSETDEDLAANCGRIEQWIVDWRRDRGVVGR